MAGNKQPIFQVAPKTTSIDIQNADGVVLKDLFTGGTNGSLIDNISVTNTDSGNAVDLVLTINDGVDDRQVGILEIPLSAGITTAAPAVNLLDAEAMPFFQSGGGLPLGPGAILKINASSAVSGVISIVAYGGDY